LILILILPYHNSGKKDEDEDQDEEQDMTRKPPSKTRKAHSALESSRGRMLMAAGR
jgi:hypothetical protein